MNWINLIELALIHERVIQETGGVHGIISNIETQLGDALVEKRETPRIERKPGTSSRLPVYGLQKKRNRANMKKE